MYKGKHAEKSVTSIQTVLFRAVGCLLILTLLSTSLVSSLMAKYVVGEGAEEGARVAYTGIEEFAVLEHFAKETYTNSGVYELDKNTEVKKNENLKVLPGVDFPKDPFIRLKFKDAEVDYKLYLQVTESNPFPDTITYKMEKNWKEIKRENGSIIYQYMEDDGVTPVVFEAGTDYPVLEIPLIEKNKLIVSQYYVGNGQDFSLTFSAYLRQVD